MYRSLFVSIGVETIAMVDTGVLDIKDKNELTCECTDGMTMKTDMFPRNSAHNSRTDLCFSTNRLPPI